MPRTEVLLAGHYGSDATRGAILHALRSVLRGAQFTIAADDPAAMAAAVRRAALVVIGAIFGEDADLGPPLTLALLARVHGTPVLVYGAEARDLCLCGSAITAPDEAARAALALLASPPAPGVPVALWPRLAQVLDADTEHARLLAAEIEHARLQRDRPRRALHRALDALQQLVPESLRTAVRPAYLRLYRRVFPGGRHEFAPPAPPPAAVPLAGPSTPRVSGPRPSGCLIETQSLDTGGLERVAADLAFSLRDAGFPTSIAVTGRGGKIADECSAAGIPVHFTGNHPAHFQRVLREEQAGILIPHYANFGAPLAWRAGLPVVSFLHNAYIWTDAAEDRAMRATDPCITRYIAVSETVKSYFCRKYGVDPGKVMCVPNGVNIARLEESARRTPRVTRASLGLAAEDYVLLNVAALIGVKSQLHAVCAVGVLAERCPRLRLVLLPSHADPVYAHEVRALVKELGLAGRVLLCPATDQVSDYYRLADAFLLPSLIEGWSLAKTEAMFFGLPLILTEVGGAAEVIAGGDIGILVPPAYRDARELAPANLPAMYMNRTPRNLPALVAAMEDFYQRPDYWRVQGRDGTTKVRARFDLRKVAAEHLRVIRTVLAQHYGM